MVLSPQGGHCGHHGLSAAGCGGGARVLGHARWNRCSGRADGRLCGDTSSAWRRPSCSFTRCARGSVWPAARMRRGSLARRRRPRRAPSARERLPARFGVEIIAGIIFTAIAYVCGYSVHGGGQVDLARRFTAVAPFMVVGLLQDRGGCHLRRRRPRRRAVASRAASNPPSKCQLGPEMVGRATFAELATSIHLNWHRSTP